MNRIPRATKLLLVAAAFLLPVTWTWAQEDLTLERAIEKALKANPELAVDGPGRAAAVAEFQASRAGYFPKVDVEQSLLGGNNPVYVFGTLLTQRRFTAANFELSSLNTPDPVKNLQTRVVAQKNIWDFGRTAEKSGGSKAGDRSDGSDA
jgi:outer membrane protein TolC